MSAHEIMKCRGCGTVLRQCRCPSPDKTVVLGECSRYPKCTVPQPSIGESEHDYMARQLEQLRAKVAELEAEATDSMAAFVRVRDENALLIAEAASLRSRRLGEAELYYTVTCPKCQHSAQMQLKTQTIWQVAPGLAVVTEQLRELREAAEAYKRAHEGTATEADEAAQHLWDVLAKQGGG